MADEKEVVAESTPDVEKFLGAIDRTTGAVKPEEKPVDTGEKKVETTQEKPAETVETTTQQVTTEETKPAPVVETAKEKPVETAVKPAPQPDDWKKAIKSVDRKELLKEAGLDEFDLNFIEFRAGGGDPYAYLQAKTRDWSKMSDDDVLRHDLRKQLPDVPEDQFNKLAERRINQRFPAGDEMTPPEEKEMVALEKKLEADALRKKYAEEDSRFTIPEKKADAEAEKLKAAAEQAKKDTIDAIVENPATKRLYSEKKIVAGEGKETVPFDVDPESIMSHIVTENNFFPIFNKPVLDAAGNQTGEFELDNDLLYATIHFAKNRKAYEKALIDFGKTLGVKAEVNDLHHIPKEEVKPTSEKKETLNEAFAKRGVDVVR